MDLNQWTSGPRLRLLLAAALVVALLMVLFGCAGEGRQGGPAAGVATPVAGTAAPTTDATDAAPPTGGFGPLVPVPAVDVSRAEPGARKQLGEQRAALDALRAKADADPAAVAKAFGDLGLLYVTYEFLDAAEACFADARALQPADYRWHYLLGYLKSIQGKLPEAMPLFEKTLELAPQYQPAQLRVGRALLEMGRYPEARARFEKALQLDPKSAAAQEGLGKVAAATGDAKGAIAYFQRALELDPEATGLHYALGQAYRNLGDLDRARAELEKGETSPPASRTR